MSRALTVAVAASVLGHALLVAVLASRAWPVKPPAPQASPATAGIDLDFSVDPMADPARSRDALSPATRTIVRKERELEGAHSGVGVRSVGKAETPREDHAPHASSAHVARPEVPLARAPTPVDLSPTAVARAELGELPVPAAPTRSDAAGSTLDNTPMTGERLDQYLKEATRNTAISRAPDPVLEPHGDGGYTFEGNGIRATIDPDGQVHFEDVFRRGTSFDLTGWVEKKRGGSPNRSEQRWFMERTAELRERLAQRTFRLLASLDGPQVVTVLGKVWSDPRLSVARRKQETLRLWVAAGASEQRESTRELIEGFVREQCPKTALCAFTIAELAEFNGARKGERFEPYASR